MEIEGHSYNYLVNNILYTCTKKCTPTHPRNFWSTATLLSRPVSLVTTFSHPQEIFFIHDQTFLKVCLGHSKRFTCPGRRASSGTPQRTRPLQWRPSCRGSCSQPTRGWGRWCEHFLRSGQTFSYHICGTDLTTSNQFTLKIDVEKKSWGRSQE